jgi:hypothetical protein
MLNELKLLKFKLVLKIFICLHNALAAGHLAEGGATESRTRYVSSGQGHEYRLFLELKSNILCHYKYLLRIQHLSDNA